MAALSQAGRSALAALLVVTSACGDDLGPAGEAPPSSFQRIQTEIFAPSCIFCHTADAHDATRSGLVLDPAVAYQNLVGAAPTNEHARADGLRRVAPLRPDSSLLLHKLVWQSAHHGRDYGSPMPLGGAPPSVGQVEFVRRWIAAGAPATGDTIDAALLADRTAQDLTPFAPLQPPARGYQLRVGRFDVAPDFERELFVLRGVGNTEDAFVNRIETSMRVGSHHFVIYRFPQATPAGVIPPLDVVRDIRRADGSLDFLAMLPMAYHVFVGGAMTNQADWRLPPGVALRLPPGTRLDLNSHYVNRTDAATSGEVYANLHTLDPADVQHEAHPLNLSNTNITLPPRARTTLSRTFTVPERVSVFLLTSHMHEQGERFLIRIAGGPRDGEVVYETTSWSHPDITTYTPPIVLNPGEGLRSEITYNNTTDATIRFGLTSLDEMGIIFGYYYCEAVCASALPALSPGVGGG